MSENSFLYKPPSDLSEKINFRTVRQYNAGHLSNISENIF